MSSKIRMVLLLITLGCFMVWCGAVMAAMIYLQQTPDAVRLWQAFGLGGITQFFIVILTLGYQFFFRKRGTSEAS